MLDQITQPPTYEETIKMSVERAGDWQLKFVLWPHRCALSGKQIWVEHAYRGTRIITGPGTPVVQHYWIDRNEFIVWKLKQQ
jgi:hypothetical protein